MQTTNYPTLEEILEDFLPRHQSETTFFLNFTHEDFYEGYYYYDLRDELHIARIDRDKTLEYLTSRGFSFEEETLMTWWGVEEGEVPYQRLTITRQ